MKLINMKTPDGNRLGILTERGVIDVAAQASDPAVPRRPTPPSPAP